MSLINVDYEEFVPLAVDSADSVILYAGLTDSMGSHTVAVFRSVVDNAKYKSLDIDLMFHFADNSFIDKRS